MQTKATKAYLYGALAGALAIASVLVTTYFLGKASYLWHINYLRTSGRFHRGVGSPGVTSSLSYYIKEKVVMDWQFMLVIGIGLGAFISSMLNKEFLETVPLCGVSDLAVPPSNVQYSLLGVALLPFLVPDWRMGLP